jgi:hypothetical protein
MANVTFQITLQDAEISGEFYQLPPNSPVRGTVTVLTDSDVTCKNLFVHLIWHTQGRGTRFSQTAVSTDLFQGTISANMPRAFEFDLHLPNEPWSYEGHYVSIVWKIQAQINVSWASDPTHELPFICRPLPPQQQNQWSY